MNRIMIVDDSSIDRKIMARVITEIVTDAEILENTTGEDVLSQIIFSKISLVILDLMLPTTNGMDLLKEIKADEFTKDIPVIICSGLDNDDIVREALSLGAYDFFQKPLSSRAVKFLMALKVRNGLALVQKVRQISYLMNHDLLTGLKARPYFEMKMSKFYNDSSRGLSVLMVDIDGLKIFNDAYGRLAGDRILRRVGEFINEHNEDVLISCRWGSDEFLMLVRDYDKHRCEAYISSMMKWLEVEEIHGINVSYGLASKKENDLMGINLLQKVEEDLYSNKILADKSIRSRMLESIRQTLHEKNPREEMHSVRVSEISGMIALVLGFTAFEVRKVQMAGLMHDVGKISIDERILNKPGKLKNDEWEAIKKHPEVGYRILSSSADTMDIAEAVLSHHERFDGKGYPRNLAGEEIPLLARIISVADSFDAMTGPRTYKKVYSVERAVEEIIGASGSQFDPTIVDAFLELLKKGKISNDS